MKKSDIAILVLIVSISLAAAYFIGQAIFGGHVNKPVAVEAADPLTAEVVQPDPRIFNKDAINPTVHINIGDSNNQKPFGN